MRIPLPRPSLPPRALTLAALLLAACQGAPADDAASAARAPAAPLVGVATRARGDLAVLARDTLSDSAHVLRLVPAPAGAAAAVLFADPGHAITSGLALLTEEPVRAQLLWPDAVEAAWWTAPHALAFRTAQGVRGVADVRAESLMVVTPPDTAAPHPPVVEGDEERLTRVRARATAFVDSVYLQPGGVPAESALRYRVRGVLPSPDRTLAAVYVAASADGGELLNPAWLVVDPGSGRVERVDEITGPATEMPEAGGGWTDTGRFLYTKGLRLWEAEFARRVGG